MSDPTLIDAWAKAFAFTILIEAPIVTIGFMRAPIASRLGALITANFLTHPALWFLFPRFEPYLLWVTVAELLVTLIEWQVYRSRFQSLYSSSYVLAVSVCANVASTIFGLVIWQRYLQ